MDSVKQAKPKIENLMTKLYSCGRYYIDNPDSIIRDIQDNWESILSEKDMKLLTKVLYGEKKCKPYKKRTKMVDADFTHGYVEQETKIWINDIIVIINWADSGEYEKDDNVSNYVCFFISGKLPKHKKENK